MTSMISRSGAAVLLCFWCATIPSGCGSDEIEGGIASSNPDDAGSDSATGGVSDAVKTDTVVVDTAAPDTAAPDTAVPDTAAADTASMDSNASDVSGSDSVQLDSEAAGDSGENPEDTGKSPDGSATVDCDKDTDCPDAAEECEVAVCSDVGTCELQDKDDGAECNDDNACTSTGACTTGKCVAGLPVQCDDGNPCTANACDSDVGCTAKSTQAACNDGNPCTTGDACAGGSCSGGGAKDCDDGNACTDDTCSADAGCQSKINSAACDDGDACSLLDVCAFGKCTGNKAAVCNDGDPCTDDGCDKAKGCVAAANSGPCDDGDACTVADQCKSGACAGGKAKVCDDGDACTTDVCDKSSGCKFTASDAACSDSNACTSGDSCKDGSCKPGPAVVCEDNNACTTDYCDPSDPGKDKLSGCRHVANALPCDDGSVCTANDACKAGKCAAGKALDCADNSPCTDDSCDAVKGCVNLPNKATCDDGNKCTSEDHCDGGACKAGKVPSCDDGNPCTTPTCDPGKGCANVANTHPCDDGSACTTSDVCADGKCSAGKPVTCNDFNACTDDSCSAKTGCVHLANSVTCTDGNACTAGDKCGAKQCKPGAALSCDDGNACTTDGCAPDKGCGSTPNALGCSDGTICTTNDVCSEGACVAGASLPCKDGNACTDDGCDAKSGCTFTANKAPCDDGNKCTASDACAAGQCSQGAPVQCADQTPCTLDFCDSTKGCVHLPTSSTCSDDSVCTVADHCTDSKCVGNPLGCDDGNPCTADSCDAKTGCKHGVEKDGAVCGKGGLCKSGSCEIGTKDNPAPSCNDVQSALKSPKSGVFTIDPDGIGGAAAFAVYCDFDRDGGGWTQVLTSSDDGAATWTWNKRTLLSTNKALVGAVTARNKDFKSAAHHLLTFDDVMFVHYPSKVWAVYDGVGDGKQALAAHIAAIKEQQCYDHGTGHVMTAGNLDLASSGKFCETRLYFNMADRDGNPSKCGDNDGAFGPAWSVSSNNPCPMDDPGQKSGFGPKQAGGNTEYGARGYGDVLGLNKGKAGAAQNYLQVFVRRAIAPGCGNGKLEGAEACDDGNKLGGDGCSATCDVETVTSCAALANTTGPKKSGVYSLDPDGAGGKPAFDSHCEMDLDKGGWTLAYTSSDDGVNTWTWANRALWTNGATVGTATAWTKDFKSPAAHVPFKDVLVVHSPSGVWASYHGVGSGNSSLAGHIASVGGPVCYEPLKGGHTMNAGTLKVGAKLCDTRLYFNPDDRDGSKTKCGDDEKTWGPAFNARDNQACPWDDPGISGSCGPSLSNPGAEYNTRGFGRALNLNTATAGTGQNHVRIYVR